MRKAETLRGRGSFQSLYRSGRRIDGEVLRCFFRWETGAGTLVRAGFSISAKRYNAVKRNRAKRLMRAAFDLERARWLRTAEAAGRRLSVLFVYSGTREATPEHFTLEPIRMDLGSLCRKVSALAAREHHMKKGVIAVLRAYQILISPLLPPNTCRFIPTCSQYAIDAVAKYGVPRGSLARAETHRTLSSVPPGWS